MVNYLRTNLCFAAVLAICVVLGANQTARAQTPGVTAPPLNQFYQQLERTIISGRAIAYLAMLSPSLAAQPSARQFVRRNILAGVTNVTIKELGRLPLSDVPEVQVYAVLL